MGNNEKPELTSEELENLRIQSLILLMDEFLPEDHIIKHSNHWIYFKKKYLD